MKNADSFVAALHEWAEITMRRSMRNVMRHTKESGLSMSQMGTLFYLQRCGHSGVSGLGGHLGITNAAASQMLDRLVEQGLILRSEDPQDRRIKRLTLTEQGRQMIYQSLHAHQAWLEELSASLTPQEKEAFIPALRTLTEKAKQIK